MKPYIELDDVIREELKDNEFKMYYDDAMKNLNVVEAIISARSNMNITQEELSKLTGINQADISKIEHGKRPASLKTLNKILNALGKRIVISIEDK